MPVLFGDTHEIAQANARNALTPLQKVNKTIKKDTKALASAVGSQIKSNAKYNNLVNDYYNDLAYSRNARIGGLDTPDSGNIWSTPEAAQSYYWQTTGQSNINSTRKRLKAALESNSQLASDISSLQNLLQQAEQDKSYDVQQKIADDNIFSGLFESALGVLAPILMLFLG